MPGACSFNVVLGLQCATGSISVEALRFDDCLGFVQFLPMKISDKLKRSFSLAVEAHVRETWISGWRGNHACGGRSLTVDAAEVLETGLPRAQLLVLAIFRSPIQREGAQVWKEQVHGEETEKQAHLQQLHNRRWRLAIKTMTNVLPLSMKRLPFAGPKSKHIPGLARALRLGVWSPMDWEEEHNTKSDEKMFALDSGCSLVQASF
eukprot:1482639-Amphidinium_carterae.1